MGRETDCRPTRSEVERWRSPCDGIAVSVGSVRRQPAPIAGTPLNTFERAECAERSMSCGDLFGLMFGRGLVSAIRPPALFPKWREAVVAGIGPRVPGAIRVLFRAPGGLQVLGPSAGSWKNFPVVDQAHGSESRRIGNGAMQ